MKKGTNNLSHTFHAGHLLQQCLQASGHDVEWLAEKTGRTMPEIEALFALPNMDAELFVRMRKPMGDACFDRVHKEIFPNG